MELFLALLATLAFASCAVIGLGLRVTRSVRRRVLDVRDRVRLAARSHAGGEVGEVARLRRDLARAVTAARTALEVSRAVDAPVGDVPSLLVRLETAAQRVDGELRLLESQQDPARLSAGLAGPRARAGALVEAGSRLVDGLLEAAGSEAPDVARLRADATIEAAALRAARLG